MLFRFITKQYFKNINFNNKTTLRIFLRVSQNVKLIIYRNTNIMAIFLKHHIQR